MKRIGFQKLFLALLLVLFAAPWLQAAGSDTPASGATTTTASEPEWAPTITLPKDTSIFLCASDSICYDVKGADVDLHDTLTLSLVSGPISFPTTKFPTNSFVQHICFTPSASGTYRFIWKVTDHTNQTATDTVTYTVKINRPPQMSDQFFSGALCSGDTTRVLPIVATDPDGDVLHFTLISGNGTIDNLTGELTYYTKTAGVRSFVVAVSDACASDTATIEDTVTINLPPYLVTKDTVLHVCDTSAISLDVVGHDPEGGPVQIVLSEGPGEFVMTSDTSGKITFIPARVDSAQYRFVYCITDDCLGRKAQQMRVPICVLDTVTVTVHLNRKPVLTCPADKVFSGCSTGPFCWTVSSSDPDGDAVTLHLLSNNATLEGNQVCVSPQQPGSFDVVIEAVDKCGAADTCTTHVTVNPNHAPVVTSAQDFAVSPCVPEQVCFQVLADDVDMNIAHVTPNFGTYDKATNKVCFMADSSGKYTIITTAADSCGATGIDTTVVTVTLNKPPVVHLNADTTIKLCQPEEICLPYVATDANLKSVVTNLGQIKNGTVCFTPETSGTFTIILTATDDCNVTVADTQLVTVNIGRPAVLQCKPEYDYFVCATDTIATFCFSPLDPADTGAVTLRVLTGNGVVNGREICVSSNQSADFVVRIEATGSCGKPDTCETLVKMRINQPPHVQTAQYFSIFICKPEPVCFEALVDDPESNVVSVHVNYGTYDKATNRVCFNADTTGNYRIIVTATDTCGATAKDTTIVNVWRNQLPEVSIGNDSSITLCEAGPICVPAVVIDENLKLVTSNLGIYSRDTRTVCFTPDTNGLYTLILAAEDSCGFTAADTVHLKVRTGHKPVVTLKDTSIYVCYPHSVCLPVTISDIDGDIKSVTVNRGTYANGSVCFVPYSAGIYPVTVTVTDSCGNVVSATGNVTIRTDQNVHLIAPHDTSIFQCGPDTLCFPIGGIPDDATVKVYGTNVHWNTQTKSVCFYSDCCLKNDIKVEVTTACGNKFTASFSVSVQTNSAPIVAVPRDTTIFACEPGGRVCMPIAVNDIDRNIASVTSTFGEYDAYRQILCFNTDTAGVYTAVITAKDSCGLSAAATTRIHVKFNHAPAVDFIKPQDIPMVCGSQPIKWCAIVRPIDIDSNITSITATGGVYDPATHMICLTITDSGTFSAEVTVTDACGLSAVGTVSVWAERRDSVKVQCSTPPDPENFCKRDSIWAPVFITGNPTQVITNIGEYRDGRIYLPKDTTKAINSFDIRVIAVGPCNTDTCSFNFYVQWLPSTEIVCPHDTTIVLCQPGTLSFPIGVIGDILKWTVTPPAYMEGITLKLPVTETGTYPITLIANGMCGDDTCSFTVHTVLNSPPVVQSRDTTLLLCKLQPVCLPIHVTDIDGNIVSITTSLGQILGSGGGGTGTGTGTKKVGARADMLFNGGEGSSLSPSKLGTDTSVQVCFTPDRFGDYKIIVTATDACVSTVDTVTVTVNSDGSVAIVCPTVEPSTLCKPDTLCIPITITGSGFNVTTSFGKYENGHLCIPVDTGGVYSVRVIGTAPCNADTCNVTIPVTMYNPVHVVCRGTDTTVFVCKPGQTVSIPVSITGQYTNLTITPQGATLVDGHVVLPISQAGSIPVKIVASNPCHSDSCTFTVNAVVNRPPVVTVDPLTTFQLCQLEKVCIKVHTTDPDNNIVEVRSSLGVINDSTLCFTPDSYGDFPITIKAIDACNDTTTATTTVRIIQIDYPHIACLKDTVAITSNLPDSVRVNLAIFPPDANVQVLPNGRYDFASKQLVVYVEAPGTYTFKILASTQCGTDSCSVVVKSQQYFPPHVECLASIDTMICLTSPTTLCLPVTISGSNVNVVVKPVGTYADGKVCLPISQAGVIDLEIIASNTQSADTCRSKITVRDGRPPVVRLPADTSIYLCKVDGVCLPVTITKTDFGIANINVTGGRYVPGEAPHVCFDAVRDGLFTLIVTATDSCGHVGADTVNVNVTINKAPVVEMDSRTIEICQLDGQICVGANVEDDNLASLVTNIGSYDWHYRDVCFSADTSGVYALTLTATDSCGVSTTRTAAVTVKINRAPVIAGLRDTTVYLCKPQMICLPVSVSDPDGEQLTITTSRGTYSNGTICFAPYDSGSFQIILTATDKCGATAVDTANVHVRTDQGVVLLGPKDTTIFQCEPQLRCFPISGIPEGATVRVQGTNVQWNAQTKSVCFFSDCCLENKITVFATTQCGTYSTSFTVKVQTNSAPIVVLPRDTSYVACTFDKICLPVAVNDLDRNVASITAVGGTYDAYRQIVCVTPTGPGVYPIIVTATDSCGLKDVDTTVITLLENHAPVITFSPTDTVFKQCSPTQICIPVTVTDIDGNIAQVGVDGGTYNPTKGEVCITPTGPGHYCVTIAVVDKCGLRDTKTVCVTVLDGERVDIQCPNPRPTDTLCVAGQVCLPVPVTGTGFTVVSTYGTWAEGQLCFNADTSGTYTIKVLAKSQCNADTCTITQTVKILDKVDVACPGNKTIFLCGPDTLSYDLTLSGSVTHVTVNAPAYVVGNQVFVPVLQAGLQTITVIGTGKCGADTCSFTVTATFNSAPVVKAGKDTTLTECSLKEVCLPFTVTDLNSNVATVVTSLGVISGNTVCFTPASYGSVDIVITATDSCGAIGKDTVKVTYNQGLSAKITCPSGSQFASLCKADSVYIVVPITPPTAIVTVLPSGSYNPATGKVAIWVTSAGTKHIKVKAVAQCASDSCEFDLQVTFNEAPKVACHAPIDTLMCLAKDNQLCFPVTVTGTGVAVTVKPNGTYSAGVVCIPVSSAGKYDTKIIATGVCGADSCTVPITVRSNQAPTIQLPTDMTIQRCPQDTTTVCITGFSAKDAENPVTLTMVCGIGSYTAVRADSGSLCFKPTDITKYSFCFQATDGCNTVVDTFAVTFTPKADCDVCLKVSIDGGKCTPVGLRKQVAINVQSNEPIGGFDLLISYDASAISYQSATIQNTDITAWEYFTWKIGGAGCGQACPSGIVRLVGIADINNGSAHPPDSSLHPNGVLVYLDYLVKNDQNLGGQFVPISFVWYDCSDNSFSNPSGSLLLVDRRIYNAEKAIIWDETDDVKYPESARQPGLGAPDTCLNQGGKTPPTRCIDFVNGGICIIEADSIDSRGDVNLNGLAYEIADAVVFTNYFIRGLAAFTLSVPGQIAATDVNADGLTLTVSDLALLIRVIIGDADPIPKLNPYADEAIVSTVTSQGITRVSTETVDNIGAAYFVYDLEPGVQIGQVTAGLDAAGMDLLTSVEKNQLHVLVYNIGRNRIEAGKRELLQIPISGSGAIKLSHVELVDYQGRPYTAKLGRNGLPEAFALGQNYPNPFNPSTVISFSLPQSSNWALSIYNVTGALVREFEGSSDAGTIEVTWDGRAQSGAQAASGIYLYKLRAGSFNDTKKMILLK